jgi:outer membrane protein assembly factor BamB
VRVDRPTAAIRESPDSYSTPQLLKYGNHVEIVVLGGDCVTGHDPATGKELWRGNGLNPTNNPNYRTIASAVVFGGVVYAPTRERSLVALRAGGSGDITESHKLSTVLKAGDRFEVLAENDLADYMLSSPAISDGHIFLRTTHFLYAIGKR